MSDEYRVWAVEYVDRRGDTYVVAVSAESEYGAIKRLVGNRCVLVRRVEEIPGRLPLWAERRIEGVTEYTFSSETLWEYT